MLIAYPVRGNSQKLDGGAMFGNAPRALWSRWSPPDENGRIDLACRALLIEHDGARLLFETGIGAFFDPKLKERYGVVEDHHVLMDSLAALGLSDADIDVVVLSHLHFDHAGGLLAAHEPGQGPRLLFPRARFVTSRIAFERARHPHVRDRASFIEGLANLLEESQRLELVGEETRGRDVLGDPFSFRITNGHTPGMLHTLVSGKQAELFYCADLVPGESWVHLPITMGYDRFPEKLIDEKEQVFRELLARRAWLFFTHDPKTFAGRLTRDDRDRYRLEDHRLDTTEGWELD